MAIREDDIRSLGLDIGEEVAPQALTACSGCQTEHEHGLPDCTNRCQACERCQSTCEKSCQNCEGRCQSTCEKSSQCYDCEYDCQTNYQRRCQYSCQDYCENNCQNTYENSYQDYCEKNCQKTCLSACQDAAQKNRAPSAPTSITVPNGVKDGETIIISWPAATDSDGNLSGYMLEKKTDDASFVQIYKGSSRSFSDTIIAGTNKVQYRVRAYDSYGKVSGYRASQVISVTNNSSPVISGQDSDLGGKKAPFKFNLSVSDKDNDTVDVICKLNGSILRTINNIKLDSNYEVSVDAERFNALALNTRNEIEISASDSKSTSYRRYTFARINAAPEIMIDKADYGDQNKPFGFTYKITDAENDKCSVRILYGTRVLEFNKEVELNKELSYTFGKLDFAKIPTGEISIKIEATDINGGVSSKLVTFTKSISGCGYIYKKDTAKNATQAIVSVSRNVDEKSVFKAYVCNNANDADPTWEEVTDMLDKIYTIKNTTKTASSWAFGLKVEIVRGKDAGDSYLNAVGYSYR